MALLKFVDERDEVLQSSFVLIEPINKYGKTVSFLDLRNEVENRFLKSSFSPLGRIESVPSHQLKVKIMPRSNKWAEIS